MFYKTLIEVKEKYNNLQSDIYKLNSKIFEQNWFINNVEILSIFYTTNESLIDIITIVVNKLNVNLNTTDTFNIYWIQVNINWANKIIIYLSN